MSLDYDLSEIENYKDLCWTTAEHDEPMYGIKAGDRIISPVTKGLIFATMGMGIGRLNEDTLDEFAARLKFWQAINGALLDEVDDEGNATPRPLNEDDLKAHRGLRTNVSYEPREDWLKRIGRQHFPRTEPGCTYFLVEFQWGDEYNEQEVAAASLRDAIAKATAQVVAEGWHTEADLKDAVVYVDGEEVAA